MASNLFVPYFVEYKTETSEGIFVGLLVELTDKAITLCAGMFTEKSGRRGFQKPTKFDRETIIEHYPLKSAVNVRRVGAVDAIVVDADTAPI